MHRMSPIVPSLCLSLAVSAASVAAAPVELAGVTLQDRAVVADTPLVLNGAGIRYKAVFKVYTAGLYLGTKASTTEEVAGGSLSC